MKPNSVVACCKVYCNVKTDMVLYITSFNILYIG